jgi:hypothetical protein
MEHAASIFRTQWLYTDYIFGVKDAFILSTEAVRSFKTSINLLSGRVTAQNTTLTYSPCWQSQIFTNLPSMPGSLLSLSFLVFLLNSSIPPCVLPCLTHLSLLYFVKRPGCKFISAITFICRSPVAQPCTTCTLFARSNAGIVGSNCTWGVDVCVRLLCLSRPVCR